MNAIVRPQFYLDVEEEVAFLTERAGAEVAARWYDKLWETADLLKSTPYAGRPRADLDRPRIRSWRVKHFARWLIFYEVREPDLVLYRVRSGLMNLVVLRMDG